MIAARPRIASFLWFAKDTRDRVVIIREVPIFILITCSAQTETPSTPADCDLAAIMSPSGSLMTSYYTRRREKVIIVDPAAPASALKV